MAEFRCAACLGPCAFARPIWTRRLWAPTTLMSIRSWSRPAASPRRALQEREGLEVEVEAPAQRLRRNPEITLQVVDPLPMPCRADSWRGRRAAGARRPCRRR